MTESEKYLQQLDFWEYLTASEKKAVKEFSVIRAYKKDSLLHATDGDCLGMVIVLEGSVRAYMMSEEGKEITLYHIRAGECDVLTASCIMYQITFETQMIIEQDSRIMIIPTTVLAGLKEKNIYVRSFIYETLTERFSDVMWTIQQILFFRIDQRVAAYLIKHSSGGEVRATHEQIAKEINTAREVVARIIKHFSEDGILRSQRGRILITDPEKLLRMTEETLLQ